MPNSKKGNVVNIRHKIGETIVTGISWDEEGITIHVKPGYDYFIAADSARTCSEICNWLGQIQEKSWASCEILGKLVVAFSYLNGDLRGIK